MKKKIYGYDVYYRLKTPSSVLVAAHNKKEARRIAEETLNDMSRDELISRFLAALNFAPEFQITYADRIDELDEEDLEKEDNQYEETTFCYQYPVGR